MKTTRLLIIAVVVCLMNSGVVAGSQIYSSGSVLGPTQSYSGLSQAPLQFETQFDAILNRVAFWFKDTTDGTGPNFTRIGYSLWGGAIDAPTLLAAGSGANINYRCPCLFGNLAPAGSPPEMWETYGAEFDTEIPIQIERGNPYWLTLDWDIDTTGVSAHANWAISDSGDRAFALDGDMIATATPNSNVSVSVAEPTSLLCLLTAAIFWLLYRRRKLKCSDPI